MLEQYVDQKDSAAILAIKRSVGVADKQGIHPGFETNSRYHQKSETGVLVALQKGLLQKLMKLYSRFVDPRIYEMYESKSWIWNTSELKYHKNVFQ